MESAPRPSNRRRTLAGVALAGTTLLAAATGAFIGGSDKDSGPVDVTVTEQVDGTTPTTEADQVAPVELDIPSQPDTDDTTEPPLVDGESTTTVLPPTETDVRVSDEGAGAPVTSVQPPVEDVHPVPDLTSGDVQLGPGGAVEVNPAAAQPVGELAPGQVQLGPGGVSEINSGQ